MSKGDQSGIGRKTLRAAGSGNVMKVLSGEKKQNRKTSKNDSTAVGVMEKK